MATSASLSRLVASGLCQEATDDDSDNSETPLILRRMTDHHASRRKATYGRKTAVGRLAAMFQSPRATTDNPAASAERLTSADSLPATSRFLVAEDSSSDVTSSSGSRATDHALQDITEAFENVLQIQDHPADEQGQTDDDEVLWIKPKRSTRSGPSSPPPVTPKDPREAWLEPLITAYEKEGRQRLTIQKWTDVLDDDWKLEKMAESSFAEVYKVKNDAGTSVLKLMALKPPKGPGSRSDWALPVESVISEVMILNIMTELRGFLEFKEAHIIDGRPPKAIAEAYEAFAAEKETFFPKPAAYNKRQLFLALELGDAGSDLEHFQVTTHAQLWDIFLGTTLALAAGEQNFKFEHRDLHEGNVCVKQVHEAHVIDATTSHRYGYSGLEITVLDYTLSRAEKGDTIISRDLEEDYALFEKTETLQQQMYCRMRNWALFGTRRIANPSLDGSDHPQQQRGSWEDFMPYTNVIWLWFLLDYVMKHYKGPKKDMAAFRKQTSQLRKRLHPDTKMSHGSFRGAYEVLEYALQQKWIDAVDLESSQLG
ncbi:MAG: hypothetical protein M1818_003713 [Claussenomyces sp. TS43310]|nr:MAG: hypothetical protein M1818_003713 [Claussenomyces sp. TS43310]